jgi:hypothetical protein
VRRPSWGCLSVISALCMFPLMSGCRNGGGNASSRLDYSGASSPATLTSSNAATLIGNAYSGGNSGIIVGGVAAGIKYDDYGAPRRPRSLNLSKALIKFVHLTAVDHALAMPETAATASNLPRPTIHGTCGGTATVDGSYDDDSHTISLSADLSDYCRDGMKLNGTIGALGRAVADGQDDINISKVTLTLADLSVAYQGDSFTADGTISIMPQPGYVYVDKNILLTSNMLFKDDATTKIYKLENFRISRSSAAGTVSYDDITINGRFYDPDEGYIDLSTPATMRVVNNDAWPSSGSLRARGANCSATITAQSDTTYQLDVDSDGNGSVDSRVSGLWANI